MKNKLISKRKFEFIVDSQFTVIKLISMILFNESFNNDQSKRKNTLVGVSLVKYKRLEIVRLILFLLYLLIKHNCNNNKSINKTFHISVQNYSDFRNREFKDIKAFKRLIQELNNIIITFYDTNRNTVSEPLFDSIQLKNEIIYYKFNPFIMNKITLRGRGHRKVKVPWSVFWDENSSAHKYNILRFYCFLKWTSNEEYKIDNYQINENKLEQIYKTKMQENALEKIVEEYNQIF